MSTDKIMIRMSNWVGDFIMNLPAAELIRKAYPGAEIHWFGRPYLQELAAFRSDLFDRYIEFDDKGELKQGVKLIQFARNLRHEKFTRAFIFTSHFKGALLPWLGRVPERIGYSKPFFSFLLTKHEKKFGPTAGRDSFVSMFLDLLKVEDIDVSKAPLPSLNRVQKLEEETLNRFVNNVPRPYLLIHAGAASSSAKMWLPSRFAEMGDRFHHETGGTAILLGVNSEADINNEIMATVKYPDTTINLTGKTSLRQAIALIGASDYMLSNDSGFMHVASAYRIPHVTIYGPTDPTLSSYSEAISLYHEVDCAPCHKKLCPVDHICMTGLTSDVVWKQGLDPLIQKQKACDEPKKSIKPSQVVEAPCQSAV